MAQWTLNAGCYFRPYRSAKAAPTIRHFVCSTVAGSTARIKVGMPVTSDTLVSSAAFRAVRPKIATSNAQMEIAITSLLGIAGETDTVATSAVVGATIPIYVADGQTEWLGYCAGAGVVNSTMIGQTKNVIWDSTLQTFFIDSTNSTAALNAVTITDVPDYSLGSTNGPVVFRFLSSLASPIIK